MAKPKTNFDQDVSNLKKSYLVTFSSPEGAQVFADLKTAYYKRGSYSKDPYETAYREGQRSVLIRILNFMEDENG